ncbi:MAG: hypothetical protein ABI002_05920, partial [Saprospiraceae bacterium]
MKRLAPLDATKAGRLNLPNFVNVAALPAASAPYTGALAWCVAEGAVYKCNGSAWTVASPAALWYLDSGIMFQTTPGKVVINSAAEYYSAYKLEVKGTTFLYNPDNEVPLIAEGGFSHHVALLSLRELGGSIVANMYGSYYSENLFIGQYYGSDPHNDGPSSVLAIGTNAAQAANTSAVSILALGNRAAPVFTTGQKIIALGDYSLGALVSGDRVTATGYRSLQQATAVTDATAFGAYAGGANAGSNPQESANFGAYAGFGRNGNRGVYIGYKAGYVSGSDAAGDGNLVFGNLAASNTTLARSIVIGDKAMSEVGGSHTDILWLHNSNGATPG